MLFDYVVGVCVCVGRRGGGGGGGGWTVANNLTLKDMLRPASFSVHREAVVSSDAKDAS